MSKYSTFLRVTRRGVEAQEQTKASLDEVLLTEARPSNPSWLPRRRVFYEAKHIAAFGRE